MQTHVFGEYNHGNDVNYHLLGHEINLANCLLDGSFDFLLLFIFNFLSDLIYTDFQLGKFLNQLRLVLDHTQTEI